MGAPDQQLPVLFRLRSNPNFIVFSIVFAVFTDIVLYGLIVPVFPFALVERANIPREHLQRWISILLATFGVGTMLGSLVFGRLADKYNTRRTPLLAGLITLMGATLLLWFGRNIVLLVIARFLQGLTAACVWSVGVALIVDTTSGEKGGSTSALGKIGMAMSFGFVLAPSIGGVIYDRGGYNAVFATSIAVIFVDIVLRLLIIEKKVSAKYLSISRDDERQQLIPASSSSSSSASVQSQNSATTTKSPFLILIKNPRILQCIFTNIVQSTILTSLESVLPLHLRAIFGYDSTRCGLMFALFVAFNMFSPLVGRLCARVGVKVLATIGLLLAGLPLILLRIPADQSTAAQVFMGVMLFVIGAGDALTMTPLMMEIEFTVADAEEEHPGLFGVGGGVGLAYGFHNFAFAFGSTVGPLFAGLMQEKFGWSALTLSLGILSLFAAIPAALVASGKRRTIENINNDD